MKTPLAILSAATIFALLATASTAAFAQNATNATTTTNSTSMTNQTSPTSNSTTMTNSTTTTNSSKPAPSSSNQTAAAPATNATTTATTSNATSPPTTTTCTCNKTTGNQSQVIVTVPPSTAASGNITVPATKPANETSEKTMLITIDPSRSDVNRGQMQRITITATTDNGTAIPGAKISSVTLNYASGSNKTLAVGATDQNGQFVITTKIGGNSKPGQFNIIASAKHEGFADAKAISGFIVNPKSK